MPPYSVKFRGFTYAPVCTEEELNHALAWLNSEKTATLIKSSPIFTRFDSLGNFAIVGPGAKFEDDPFYNAACHAYLSSLPRKSAFAACVALWCANGSHDSWKGWFDWFCNRSFATEFIIGKTDNGVVVSADIPRGLMHCIAMVSRAARMFPADNFKWFNSLVEKGIPEGVAYLTCLCVGKGKIKSAFTPSSDHRPFFCPGLDGIKKFLSGKFDIRDNALYRTHRSSSCSHFISGGVLTTDIKNDPELLGLIMKNRHKDGEIYRPPNPFAPPSDEALPHGGFSYEEVYNIALPYFNEKGYFDVK